MWRDLANVLEHDWQSIARPEQLQPEGDDWVIWLFLAGRGIARAAWAEVYAPRARSPFESSSLSPGLRSGQAFVPPEQRRRSG